MKVKTISSVFDLAFKSRAEKEKEAKKAHMSELVNDNERLKNRVAWLAESRRAWLYWAAAMSICVILMAIWIFQHGLK